MALVSPPPANTPLVDGEGRITVPWRAWLQSVFALGDIVQNVVVQQTLAEDNSTDGTSTELFNQLQDLVYLLEPTAAPVADPGAIADDAINQAAQPDRSWQTQIDDLQAQISGLSGSNRIEVTVYEDAGRGWAREIADLQAQLAAISAGVVKATGAQSPAPATSADYGEPGTLAFDGSFLYVCVAPNTWTRTALSTF